MPLWFLQHAQNLPGIFFLHWLQDVWGNEMLIPSATPSVHTKSVGGVLPMKLGRVGKGMLTMVNKFHSVACTPYHVKHIFVR